MGRKEVGPTSESKSVLKKHLNIVSQTTYCNSTSDKSGIMNSRLLYRSINRYSDIDKECNFSCNSLPP